MSDPLERSAIELTEAYRAGALSPVEVARASLERIERRDPALNAFCLLDADRALADAAASEARWRRGEPAGAVDGVPVGVKDVFLTRGWPTLRGSRAIDPAGPWEDDAPAVAALRRNGAVPMGKTTTPEFGWKGVTDSPLTGVTRNPWNTSRTAGGSSGGARRRSPRAWSRWRWARTAAARSGSPCGFCGLPGIKPTFGRVPAWPRQPVRHGRPLRPDGPHRRRRRAAARRHGGARRARLGGAAAAGAQLPRRARRRHRGAEGRVQRRPRARGRRRRRRHGGRGGRRGVRGSRRARGGGRPGVRRPARDLRGRCGSRAPPRPCRGSAIPSRGCSTRASPRSSTRGRASR